MFAGAQTCTVRKIQCDISHFFIADFFIKCPYYIPTVSDANIMVAKMIVILEHFFLNEPFADMMTKNASDYVMDHGFGVQTRNCQVHECSRGCICRG